MTREEWLEKATARLMAVAQMPESSTPRVSVGFPSRGALSRTKRVLGQCWACQTASDGRAQVFVTPLLEDTVDVLAVLLHELGHVKHPEAKHGKVFKRYMRLVDLEGKATATVPGPQCVAVLKRVAEEVGPYPHAGLTPVVPEKKQSTRLLKASCPACECTYRVTLKWVGEGLETPPVCGYCYVAGNLDSIQLMTVEVPESE